MNVATRTPPKMIKNIIRWLLATRANVTHRVNIDRQFGAANVYYRIIGRNEYGRKVRLLATENEFKRMTERAKAQPEDMV